MMKSFKMKFSLLLAALVASVILITQWLFPIRVDLTENNLYSLSDGTKAIINELDEPVHLQLYFSESLADEVLFLKSYQTRVYELLKEYELRSSGKITVERVDPEPFSVAEEKATEYGLQAVPLNSIGEEIYFGLVGIVGGKDNPDRDIAVLPFLQPDKEAFLEYEVSELIHNLAQEKQPVVAVVSGLEVNGGFDMRTGQPTPPWIVMDQLEQLYEVRSLANDFDKIDSDVDMLMLVQPKALSEEALLAIDQFTIKGGKVLVFIDPLAESDPLTQLQHDHGMDAEEVVNLERLLMQWGVSVNMDKVVVDGMNALMVSTPQGTVQHLGLMGMNAENMLAEDVIVSELETVNLATPGYVEQIENSDTTFVPLISTSLGYSQLMDVDKFEGLTDPKTLFNDFSPSKEESYVLAAKISGPIETAFPDGLPGSELAVQPQGDNINVLVIADTDVLSDRLWVQVQNFFGQRTATPWADNGALILNAVEYFAGNQNLINIRSRGVFSRPFDVVDELQRQAEQRLYEKEQELQAELQLTEDKLVQLQQQNQGELELSSEQEATLVEFQKKKLAIRKSLRSVRHELNKEIDALGTQLKFINIALIPLLLTLWILIRAFLKHRKFQ